MHTPPNILIVGYGFVGKAVHHIFRKAKTNFEIHINDPVLRLKTEKSLDEMSAVFICVPTPTLEGRCDDSIVLQCLEQYAHLNVPVIIRSTIPPSSIEKALKIKRDLVYLPEFLREKHWEYDSINPRMVMIGSTNFEMADRTSKLLAQSAMNYSAAKSVKILHPVEASLFKYAANTYLAMKVVYMHELNKYMHGAGYEGYWDELVDSMKRDGRFGESHFDAPGEHGWGYSGTCFPKDVKAFQNEDHDKLTLLKGVMESNWRLQVSNRRK